MKKHSIKVFRLGSSTAFVIKFIGIGDKVGKVQIGVPNARACAAQFKLDKVNLGRDQGCRAWQQHQAGTKRRRTVSERMHNVAAASAQRDRHLLEVLSDRSRVPGGKVGET